MLVALSASINVSREVKDRIEKLRVDMGVALERTQQYKVTIERMLTFVEKNKPQFIEWIKKEYKSK
jgi:hypothetical protein